MVWKNNRQKRSSYQQGWSSAPCASAGPVSPDKETIKYLTYETDTKGKPIEPPEIIIGTTEKITLQTIKLSIRNIETPFSEPKIQPIVSVIIQWLEEIIGKHGPIYVDTKIMEHLLEELDSKKRTNDMITIKKKGGKIKIKDVRKAFEKINKNEVFTEALIESGRSYYLDNIKELCNYKYAIQWGS